MSNYKYLFGPAPSRRLGRSLGINAVPLKVCSMDCIYCEVGKTAHTTMVRKPYYRAEDIIKEFRDNFYKFENLCDVVTITGAGEPTLNSELGEIISSLKKYSSKPIALLTNTTTLHIEEVYNSLLKVDILVPSLDAISNDVFKKINIPEKSIDTKDIIYHLSRFSKEYTGKIFIEILFCKDVNDSDSHIVEMINTLKNIRYDKVQLGTIHRPPAYVTALPVDDDFLLKTLKKFTLAGINAEITGGFSYVYENLSSLDLKDLIISLLKMRPCTISDMIGVFGKSKDEIEEIINKLRNDNVIKGENYNNDTYYSKA